MHSVICDYRICGSGGESSGNINNFNYTHTKQLFFGDDCYIGIITALASATGEKRHPRGRRGRKSRREENVFKGVENLPALLYTIV